MHWYLKDPKKFEEERRELIGKYPSLTLEIRPEGYAFSKGYRLREETALIEGYFPLDIEGTLTQVAYDIAVLTMSGHPRHIPHLFARDLRLPRDIDRHILSDGSTCLCVSSERRRFLGENYRLIDFFDVLVRPFMIGQYFYELHGHWPWKDRSHGVAGVVESYKELTGFSDNVALIGFATALGRRSTLKGHELCPCGSGRRLRNCHFSLYRQLRATVFYEDAEADAKLLSEELTSRNNPE